MFSPETIIPKVTLGTPLGTTLPMTVLPWEGQITDRRPVITFELNTQGETA